MWRSSVSLASGNGDGRGTDIVSQFEADYPQHIELAKNHPFIVELYKVFEKARSQYHKEHRDESMKALGRNVAQNVKTNASLTRTILYAFIERNHGEVDFCKAVRNEVAMAFEQRNKNVFMRFKPFESRFGEDKVYQRFFFKNMKTVLGTTSFELILDGNAMCERVVDSVDLSKSFAETMLAANRLTRHRDDLEIQKFLLLAIEGCRFLITLSLCEASRSPIVVECFDALCEGIRNNVWKWPKNLPRLSGKVAVEITESVVLHYRHDHDKYEFLNRFIAKQKG